MCLSEQPATNEGTLFLSQVIDDVLKPVPLVPSFVFTRHGRILFCSPGFEFILHTATRDRVSELCKLRRKLINPCALL
jgi:hypothetical protein